MTATITIIVWIVAVLGALASCMWTTGSLNEKSTLTADQTKDDWTCVGIIVTIAGAIGLGITLDLYSSTFLELIGAPGCIVFDCSDAWEVRVVGDFWKWIQITGFVMLGLVALPWIVGGAIHTVRSLSWQVAGGQPSNGGFLGPILRVVVGVIGLASSILGIISFRLEHPEYIDRIVDFLKSVF